MEKSDTVFIINTKNIKVAEMDRLINSQGLKICELNSDARMIRQLRLQSLLCMTWKRK